MRVLVLSSCVTLILLAASLAVGAEIDDLVVQCEGCHGPAGVSAHEDIPTIGGQNVAYLEKSLRSYQVWGRPCIKSTYRHGDTSRPRTDMCQIAEGLSMEEIQALAAHYGALPFVPAEQEFDPALAARGAGLYQERCAVCHESTPGKAERGPKLAGQWTAYLRKQLGFVPTGEHLVPPAMETLVTDLPEDEIDALMNYFASRPD